MYELYDICTVYSVHYKNETNKCEKKMVSKNKRTKQHLSFLPVVTVVHSFRIWIFVIKWKAIQFIAYLYETFCVIALLSSFVFNNIRWWCLSFIRCHFVRSKSVNKSNQFRVSRAIAQSISLVHANLLDYVKKICPGGILLYDLSRNTM